MAITITANLSKKVPVPGIDWSSQQAAISISSEVSDLTHIAAESQRLFRIAEQAVDAQLAGGSAAAPVAASVQQAASPAPRQSPAQRPAASQPYRGQRREPSPISAAQARYLSQLGERSPAALAEALAQHGVTSTDALTARAASQIIDLLIQAAA